MDWPELLTKGGPVLLIAVLGMWMMYKISTNHMNAVAEALEKLSVAIVDLGKLIERRID